MFWGNIKSNSEYTLNFPRWQRVIHVVDGEYQLKKRDNEKPGTYLRIINSLDKSEYNTRLNISYRMSAVFYNATGRTLIGLLGMLYRVEPAIPELPELMEYVKTDINGNGMGINQQSHATSSKVIQIGRDGLLTDIPMIEEGSVITIADVQNGLRPFVKRYDAVHIIDWNESSINGMITLDLVVLVENVTAFVNEQRIERETKKRYRILRLTDGNYTQQLWVEGDDSPGEEIKILDGSGKPWDEIPFEFIGSENNDSKIDFAPLEPLADVNIGHYRNSADLEHSSFQLSAATPHIADDRYKSDLNRPDNKKEKVQKFGETSVIVTGTGGKFAYVQPSPNVLANDLAKNKEQQMIALGAQLISDGGGLETAEAVRTKKAADASMLSIIGVNVSNGYTKSLGWIARFLNVEFDGEFQLNSNFFDIKLTAQERQQIIVEWQSGLYPVRVAREQLQASKILSSDEDLEALQDEVDTELPSVNLE
jgi:hypothetical protein